MNLYDKLDRAQRKIGPKYKDMEEAAKTMSQRQLAAKRKTSVRRKAPRLGGILTRPMGSKRR